MNNTLLDLAKLLRDDMPAVVAYKEIQQFIAAHLSPQQRQVYDVIERKPGCSASIIEIELNLTRNHTSNLLLQLRRLKVVSRHSQGGVYRYSVIE